MAHTQLLPVLPSVGKRGGSGSAVWIGPRLTEFQRVPRAGCHSVTAPVECENLVEAQRLLHVEPQNVWAGKGP